jgi:hypothetical protein
VFVAAVALVRLGTTLACACGGVVTLPLGQAATTALSVVLLGALAGVAGVAVCRMARHLDEDWGRDVPLEDLMEVQRGQRG